MTDIFVSCGEQSGDLLGAKLLDSLSKEYRIEGVLGPNMRSAGFKEIFAMETLQVMGLSAIIQKLPKILFFIHAVKNYILKNKPKIVILFDAPDFHLFLAHLLRKNGFKGKIIQVVCPSIWAWRKGRKKTLEKNFDLLFTFFPFERDLFKDSTLEAICIGHPLVEALSSKKIEPMRELEDKRVIALFPGSRKGEILRHLPLQLKATRFTGFTRAVGMSSNSHLNLIHSIIKDEPSPPLLVSAENRYGLMQQAEFALAKFGTINLELSLLETATITHFTLPSLERIILQRLFRVNLPYYSLPNIIANEEIFREHLFPRASFKELEENCKRFALSEESVRECKLRCQKLKKILPNTPSSLLFCDRLKALLSI